MPDALRAIAPAGAIPSPAGMRLGLIVWLVSWIVGLSWAESALVFSTLVLTPLSLRALVATSEGKEEGGEWKPYWWRLAVGLQLPAGLLLVASYILDEGAGAALLAALWAVEGLILARLGASRLWSRRFRGPVGELAIDGGLLLQIVGGGWIVVHRAGATPFGFDDQLVLLSALHTHLAALALPMLLGLAARRLKDWQTKVAAALVLTGFPCVALAMVAYPPLEWPAAWLLSAGALLTAWQQLRCVQIPGITEPPARLALIGASSLSLLAGALLAGLFVALPEMGVWWLDRATMLTWHGGLLAFGFAGLGLLAWTGGEAVGEGAD